LERVLVGEEDEFRVVIRGASVIDELEAGQEFIEGSKPVYTFNGEKFLAVR
jgi:hypothetical protein